MKNTFRGGVHPEGHKELSRESRLRLFDPKGEMVFPLSQHIGKPAKPVVKKNDEVKVGQLLAEADGFISAPIHSSCSGTVKGIEKRRVIGGSLADCIVISNDGQFTPYADYTQREDASSLSNQEIINRVQTAGVVGLGGAGFPTYVKLQPKNPDAIEYVIANGAECEPYLTCNDQLMRIHSNEIVEGLELVLRLFPTAKGVICIEDNKPEAIEAMARAASGKPRISVKTMVTKYPQGGERSLIQAVAGVDFPTAQLPADVGCVVDNVGTIYAIYKAVCESTPLMERGVTITGDAVTRPCNLITRIGADCGELLEYAGGFKDGIWPAKMLAGGPMMGVAFDHLNVPLQKNNNALTFLCVDEVAEAQKVQTNCIRCGRCSHVCPMGLSPQLMSLAYQARDFERYEKKLYGLECISCGSCTFICPARRPLTQEFKVAKAEIMAAKRAAQAAQQAKEAK